MAVITGITGDITSWPTGTNAQLAGTGVTNRKATINLEAEEFDSTAFDTTGMSSFIKGLKSWSVECEALLKVIDHGGGGNGLVTYAAGYTTNIKSWTMDIVRQSHDSTIFTDTVKTYAPGLISWGGTYDGFLDDTTVMTEPGNSSEPATGTFKYQEKGATDSSLAGSIFTTRGSATSDPGALNVVSYTYRGSSTLTQSTPSAGVGIFAAGAIANTVADTLTFTASTNRTFAGSAFWEKVSIKCGVGGLVTVNWTARGSGALTIS